jgi:hypothetical protein
VNSGSSFHPVNNVFNGMKWAHEVNGLQDPTINSLVTSVLEASKRTASKKTEKKDPISTETLIELCTMFKDSTDLLIIRDLTMMLLIFSGFLRYDEISSLRSNKKDCKFPSLSMHGLRSLCFSITYGGLSAS